LDEEVIEVYQSREDWLKARIIGASDAPAIIGLNPHSTPYKLWCELTGKVPRKEATYAMRAGLLLEPLVADAVVEATGAELAPLAPWTVYRHDELPWLSATPDRLLKDPAGLRLLQLKTTHDREAWEYEAPRHVQVQVQIEIACSKIMAATAAALIDLRQLAYYQIEPHHRFIDWALERLAKFYERNVLRDIPPEITADDYEAARRAYTHPEAKYVVEPVRISESSERSVAAMFDRLEAARAAKKAATKEENEAKAKLLEVMREHTLFTGPSGTVYSATPVTRKQGEVSYTRPETTYRELERKLPS
jgi:putative phage-type endonuclease